MIGRPGTSTRCRWSQSAGTTVENKVDGKKINRHDNADVKIFEQAADIFAEGCAISSCARTADWRAPLLSPFVRLADRHQDRHVLEAAVITDMTDSSGAPDAASWTDRSGGGEGDAVTVPHRGESTYSPQLTSATGDPFTGGLHGDTLVSTSLGLRSIGALAGEGAAICAH